MAEPINTVLIETPTDISILTSSGGGITLRVPFEGDIVYHGDPQTHRQTWNIENEGLIIQLDDNNGIHTIDIKKERNDVTVIYHETIDQDIRWEIENILEQLKDDEYEGDFEMGDPVDEDGGVFITAITHENDMLKFITTDGKGLSMTFKHGDAELVEEGVYDIKKNGVHIGKIDFTVDGEVFLKVFLNEETGKYKIKYIENITEPLKAALIAILDAPAAVGGYRRRHQKTRRRHPKKKRTRKARK